MVDVSVNTPPQSAATVRRLIPGLLVAAVATVVAMLLNLVLPTVSPLLIAIVLGAVLANVRPVPTAWQPGFALCSRRFLRIGIVLLGLQLSLKDVLGLGPGMIAVVIAVVAGGITCGLLVGRWLGMSWASRLLIATGFSICGAAAVAAVEGSLNPEDKRDEDVLTAIALVVLCGTLMIPIIPALGAAFGLGERRSALWAGASIHEVAQVVAAGGAIGGGVLGLAVVVKLARVLLLAPVIAIIGLRNRSGAPAGKRPPLIPLFVAGFLLAVALRSTGWLPTGVTDVVKVIQTAFLTAAMFALGAGVRIAALRKVGWRPLALAGITTVAVAGIALGGVLLAG